jgi:hypothetical protein
MTEERADASRREQTEVGAAQVRTSTRYALELIGQPVEMVWRALAHLVDEPNTVR